MSKVLATRSSPHLVAQLLGALGVGRERQVEFGDGHGLERRDGQAELGSKREAVAEEAGGPGPTLV
jgi:hypothetical protein